MGQPMLLHEKDKVTK